MTFGVTQGGGSFGGQWRDNLRPSAQATGRARRLTEAERDANLRLAARRMKVAATLVFLGAMIIVFKMGALAMQGAIDAPKAPRVQPAPQFPVRADITDRAGRVLATSIETHGLYTQPAQVPIIDRPHTLRSLLEIFPDMDRTELEAKLDRKGQTWLRRKISPEQHQRLHDIGEPGLLFGARKERLYPNGAIASHVLGYTRVGEQDVQWVELNGVSGVEGAFEERLSDPAQAHEPLALSLDLGVQAAVEQLLAAGMWRMKARAATAVLMDVHTGEVISLASLPDYDPNRPVVPPKRSADGPLSPAYNHAVQGIYELGSTFKIFTAAQAMELGLVNADTVIDTSPMTVGGWPISEFQNKDYGPLSVEMVVVKSSNRGTARMALEIGAARQKAFLDKLGLTSPTSIELVGANLAQPILPSVWRESDVATISYGHTIGVSPLHLGAAYATLANGGRKIEPTLLRQDGPQYGEQVVRPEVARDAMHMLRQVVASPHGTARSGNVPGYAVGGKTGTADLQNPAGGYYDDRVVNTFASVFPAHDPAYSLVVTLIEPSFTGLDGQVRRSAGYTAVPVAYEIISRVAPLLGLRPEVDQGHQQGQ